MSVENSSNFDVFDILVKIIPGGAFLSLALLMFPISSPILRIFADGGFSLVIAALPITYIIGTILQGISGTCFPRQRYFQRTMRKARESLSFDEENMAISGGDPVPRFVWSDAVLYFNLDKKYLEPSDSDYDTRKYPTPLIYRILCYPLLRLAVVVSNLNKSDLNRTRKYYGGEREVFRLIEQYVDRHNLGKIKRFRSIYVLHRSMVIAACLLVPLFIVAIIASLSTDYQPAIEWSLLSILAIGVLISIPVLYSGMTTYEGIRDRRMMYAYYNSRIRDSPLSDKYAIDEED